MIWISSFIIPGPYNIQRKNFTCVRYFFDTMGQSACGYQVDGKYKVSETMVYDDAEIIADDEGDNPLRNILNKKLLQTKLPPSMNVLDQKSTNLFKIQRLSNQETGNNTISHSNFKVSNVQLSKQCDQAYPNTEQDSQIPRRKLKMSAPVQYQNIQINVGSFINIRNQNIFDFYQIKQKIGEGGFGHVFRGIQKKTGQVRAIKSLKKQMMNKANKISFINEMDLLKRLDHPNIIKLYDLFFHEGVYYVVTECCEGGSVYKYYLQQKKSISEQTTRILMKQLFSTLSYLNNLNVVHRDLKLQNIVFLKNPLIGGSQNLEIKLIDFGTAVTVRKHKKNQTQLVGTLFYIAPEIAKGFFTQKCDIWSAGVIFFLLLFGQYPFKAKMQTDLLYQISNKTIDWQRVSNRNVSKQAFLLVQSMLDKNHLTRASIKSLTQNEWIQGAGVARASHQLKQSVSLCLSKYKRKNNFVSLIESFLSFKKTTQIKRQQLSRLFCEIDKDHSGIIETDELVAFYKTKFSECNEDDIKAIVANVDKNNSGKIDFDEFLTAVSQKNILFAEQALRQAFEFIDKEGKGYITRDKLQQLLKTADKRETEEIFMNLDENCDDKITFDEFKNYILNNQ